MTLLLPYELEDPFGVRVRLLPDRSLPDEEGCYFAPAAWDLIKRHRRFDARGDAPLHACGTRLCTRLQVMNGTDAAANLWLPHYEFPAGPLVADVRRICWPVIHGSCADLLAAVRTALRAYERGAEAPADVWKSDQPPVLGARRTIDAADYRHRLQEAAA